MRTVRNEGPMGLYRGLGASVAGVLPYAGIDLAVYSLLKDLYIARFGEKVPRARAPVLAVCVRACVCACV